MPETPLAADPDMLRTAVEALLPMAYRRTAGMTVAQRRDRGALLADAITTGADQLHGRRRGEQGGSLAAIAEAIAVCSSQPGGVTLLGRHWCTDHDACVEATTTTATDTTTGA